VCRCNSLAFFRNSGDINREERKFMNLNRYPQFLKDFRIQLLYDYLVSKQEQEQFLNIGILQIHNDTRIDFQPIRRCLDRLISAGLITVKVIGRSKYAYRKIRIL
jgi:hypothetical protein